MSLPLAMHMADGLLSKEVAFVTLLLAGAALALASRKGRSLAAEKMPVMGVMGAFVFAAQMINFPILPGVSGHLAGGVLLAIVLGPWAAVIVMAAVLIVQSLLFQDGGLLALGCNIINMGVVPCLLGAWIYRHVGAGANARPWRRYLATWAACLAGVTAGAALVPLEVYASGVLQIPLGRFTAVMIGLHLLIALVEGLITFTVLAYLQRVRPAVLGQACPEGALPCAALNIKAVAASIIITALFLAGVVSWFASPHDDGLEAALQSQHSPAAQATTDPLVQSVQAWHEKIAPMPDYSLGGAAGAAEEEVYPKVDARGSVAGIIGTIATLALLLGVSIVLKRPRGRGARRGAAPLGDAV
ncbi:MAG: energy-coupling factor ABC transporter permease [Planctomycetaceae bacterium]|nr:energy-coupling factor ABC transporter permease [Planctomycetaceae bacterium]